MIQIGNYELSSVITGWCRLDGGAMFGVVPKVLWEKTEDVDEFNRILLAMRTLVAVDRKNKKVIISDTGAGGKWSEDEADRYAVRVIPNALQEAFKKMGLTESDVTDVVITHAHFDHCGGLTDWVDEPGKNTKVRFENARHWVHAKQWEQAKNPTDRDKASYLRRDYEALEDAGVLEFVEGNEPAAPFEGVKWVVSCGHTPYMILPLFEDPAHPLLFAGDMIPTSSHIRPPWVMAYDLYPLITLKEKQQVMEGCRDKGLYLAFPHDRNVGGVKLTFTEGKMQIHHLMEL